MLVCRDVFAALKLVLSFSLQPYITASVCMWEDQSLMIAHTESIELCPEPFDKATPNKFSVSRPGLRHICMRAGGRSIPIISI